MWRKIDPYHVALAILPFLIAAVLILWLWSWM